MATKLAASEVAALDPYKFMATIGKRVIHPGGRASTRAAGHPRRRCSPALGSPRPARYWTSAAG